MSPATIKPVYVLYGSDEFTRQARRQQIVAQAIGQADPQVCVSSYDSAVEATTVLDELRTLPFLAPHRVVIVSEADVFISAHRERIEKYVESPSATGTLILQTTSWPSNTRLYKVVQKAGEAIDCSPPTQQKLPQWITKTAWDSHHKKIAPQAAQLLAQWIGPNLSALGGELEKLSLYAADRAEITEKDVEALTTATVGPGAFELTNRITEGDAAGALKALGGMLTQRGEEFKTLGMIAWHLRRAMAAKQAVQAGKPPEQALPSMPFDQRGAFLAMLRRRSLGKFLSDSRALIRADLAMKSGTAAKGALQDLVVSLCK